MEDKNSFIQYHGVMYLSRACACVHGELAKIIRVTHERIFVNENVWISIKISLKFVPKDSINNIPAVVQIMACLLVPMMVYLIDTYMRHLASMS